MIKELAAIQALQVAQEQRRNAIDGKGPRRRAGIVQDQSRQPGQQLLDVLRTHVRFYALQQIAANAQWLVADVDQLA